MHITNDSTTKWDDWRVLLAVLREGSFSAAAAALRIEQSTVSRRIAALEEALGAQLFERHHHGLRATELTESLRGRLERVEGELLGALDVVHAREPDVRGRVRLAMSESLAVHAIIPHVLAPLRAEHPHLAVDLVTGDSVADLARREADLALRFFRPTGDDLVTKRVARLPLAVLASRAYRRRPRAEDLEWIVYDLPGVETPEAAYLRKHVRAEPFMRTNGATAQIAAVRSGLGVGLLPRSLLLLDSEFVEFDVELPEGPTLELWLVCLASARSVPRVDAVWEALAAAIPMLERS